jgi:hypothetical protein
MGYKKYAIAAVLLVGTIGGVGFAAQYAGVIGTAAGGPADDGIMDNPPATGEKTWDEVKSAVGLDFGSQTASEEVILVKEGVTAANYDSPDVTSVGADSDEDDTTELFESPDVEEGEDYYRYTTFGSTVTSDLPESGDYKVAVIGSGVVNEYMDYEIPSTSDYAFHVENDIPLRPLDSVSVQNYAADADVSTDDTFMVDGSSTISLDNNFSDDASDSNVDGTVTGVKEYSISGSDTAAQFGELSISNVDSNVEEVTMTVMIDGEQVRQVTDSDPADSDELNDGVEFGPEVAEDSVTVETYVEFDDSALSSSTQLLTSEVDDTDDDSTADDGSYGISALSEPWSGY